MITSVAPTQGIQAVGIVASYRRGWRRRPVLNGASIVANPGELTAIVGPNGAGKTTFLRVLLGFLRPDHGSCRIGGLPPRDYRRSRGMGYLPEIVSMPRGWTVQQLLGRAADLSSTTDARAETFARAIERAGVDSATLSRPVRLCSKGIQRRVALAHALAGEPKVVILDEPHAGLDPPSRRTFREQVRSVREGGAAILMASHDLSEVERLADRAFIMGGGTLRPAETLGSGDRHTGSDLEAEITEPGS